MRYPLFLTFSAAISGIFLWSDCRSLPDPLYWTAILFACATAIVLLLRQRALSVLLCMITVVTLFAGRVTQQNYTFEESTYGQQILKYGGHTPLLRLYGHIASPVQTHQNYLIFDLITKRVDFPGLTVRESGKFRVYISNSIGFKKEDLPFDQGDEIIFPGNLKEPRQYETPGSFDTADYYRRSWYTAGCSVSSPRLIEVVAKGWALNPVSIANEIRSNVADKISTHSGNVNTDAVKALLVAIATGDRSLIDEETRTLLKETGVFHIVAISGLHVGIVSVVFLIIFRLFRMPPNAAYLAVLFVLLFYWLLSGMAIPTTRATLLAGAWFISKILQREGLTLNLLAAIALALLWINPGDLYNPGFQLSFAAVFGISFFPDILRRVHKWFDKIPASLLATAGAQIMTIPLVMIHFGYFVSHALITNFIVLPLVSVTIALTALFSLITHWIPLLGYLTIELAAHTLFLTGEILNLIHSHLPVGLIISNKSPLLLLAALVLLFSLRILFAYTEKRILILLNMAIVCILLSMTVIAKGPNGDWPKVSFLDVATSDSCVIRLSNGDTIVVDTGGTPLTDFDMGERVVTPYLRKEGVGVIDYLVLSHFDSDHAEGTLALLRNFTVRTLVVPAYFKYSNLGQEIFEALTDGNTSVVTLARNDMIDLEDALLFAVHPPAQGLSGPDQDNNNSLILQIQFKGWQVVLTGDAEAPALELATQELLPSPGITILKLPHHGSRDALNKMFTSTLNPDIGIITASARNVFNFPHDETIAYYKELGIPLYQTGTRGTITIFQSENRLRIRTGKRQSLDSRVLTINSGE